MAQFIVGLAFIGALLIVGAMVWNDLTPTSYVTIVRVDCGINGGEKISVMIDDKIVSQQPCSERTN